MFSLLGDAGLGSPAGGNGAKNGDELDIETELKGGESNGGGLVIRFDPDSRYAQESDDFFSDEGAANDGALLASGRPSVDPSA